MAALITLCNQALDAIAVGNIASLDEASIEANKTKNAAQPLLNEMIDWSDSFAFGRTRALLASVANPRPGEWLYAYAEPADLGTPIAIRPVEDTAYGLPIGGPYTFPVQDIIPLAFDREGGLIFTNVETATLVYSKSTISATDLSPLGQKAFVDELAARLAVPIKKADARNVQALRQQAEISRKRWIADEENKSPRHETRYISEVEWARMGYGV